MPLENRDGQLMELERCRDYGIQLVVRDRDEGREPSAMIETLLVRLGLRTATYADRGDLEELVEAYLDPSIDGSRSSERSRTLPA